MKKRLFAAFLACMMAVSITACGSPASSGSAAASGGAEASGAAASSGEKYKIAYLNRDDADDFLSILMNKFIDAAEATGEIEVNRYDAGADANQQLMQFEDALVKGVDMVILLCQDKESVVSKVLECNKEGIPVLTLGIPLAEGSCEFINIGADDYNLAYLEAEYMMEKLPENGKIIYLKFPDSSVISVNRNNGIMDAIKDSGRTDYEILTTMEYDASTEAAMSLMEDMLQVYNDNFDAVITHNDKGTYGVVSAIESAGYDPSSKLIVSIDGEDAACEMISNGKMTMSVKQNMDGVVEKALELVEVYRDGGKPDADEYFIDGVLVDATNVRDYMK